MTKGDSWAIAETLPFEKALAYRDIVSVESGLTVLTSQGEQLRLTGLWIPDMDFLRGRLSEILEGRRVAWFWSDFIRDRRGRFLAHLQTDDGIWVQAALVEEGLAVVMPVPGEREGVSALLQSEKKARERRRGVWKKKERWLRAADDISLVNETGLFRVIEGCVVRVAKRGKTIYLNFGEEWRHDFTVEIQVRLSESFQDRGESLREWEGRRIRVRGWIRQHNGPMIRVVLPEALELLPGC